MGGVAAIVHFKGKTTRALYWVFFLLLTNDPSPYPLSKLTTSGGHLTQCFSKSGFFTDWHPLPD